MFFKLFTGLFAFLLLASCATTTATRSRGPASSGPDKQQYRLVCNDSFAAQAEKGAFEISDCAFVSVDGATISIQDGSPPKHLHPNANEIQYILEGTGTIWLGDKEVRVKPGDLVIIPHGTPHGGTKPDGRTIKAIAIKTPPQTPDDIKLLN